ncbi:MAG: hypothetical protein IKT00_01750 [Prevotella sp.]|nr:hypothetical protein [Prevotella sp.]
MSCIKPITHSLPSPKISLKDLINDYKKSLNPHCCHGTSMYGDLNEVLAFKMKSTQVFLKRCVCNRYRHQRRLPNVAVDNAVSKLLSSPNIWSVRPTDFEDLYDNIYNLIGNGKTGISYCTVYDTAIRLGWTFSPQIVPQKYVYVHRKLVESAKHILKSSYVIINKCRIDRSLFDKKEPTFKKLSALEIEDFLCVYHDDIMKL